MDSSESFIFVNSKSKEFPDAQSVSWSPCRYDVLSTDPTTYKYKFPQGQDEDSEPLIALSHLMQLLRTELGSSERAIGMLRVEPSLQPRG